MTIHESIPLDTGVKRATVRFESVVGSDGLNFEPVVHVPDTPPSLSLDLRRDATSTHVEFRVVSVRNTDQEFDRVGATVDSQDGHLTVTELTDDSMFDADVGDRL